MKTFLMASAGALVVAATALSFSVPASAQVGVSVGLPGVHVGVGVPAYYYGEGYYPPGPCDAYTNYSEEDCGYPVYTGDVDFDGVVVGGPHYYRWADGHPYFWYRGGWHNWDGWNRVGFNWDHREGWGWHEGRFDRDWGRAHWHR